MLNPVEAPAEDPLFFEIKSKISKTCAAPRRRCRQSSLAGHAVQPLAYKVALNSLTPMRRETWHRMHWSGLVKLDTYDSQWSFKTWVSTITRNTCIDWLRRRRRLSAYEPGPVRCSQPLPDEVLADTETKETVRAALDALPPMYREVLVLHHYQDLKYREIADTLNVPIGTVMNRIFRARKKMARTIERRAA